ncbi:TRAP transporter substrate-binding protein [Aquibaculum sediminis]|uniref:TRAP transporter substrate-binding protein n=1 Tax=Aquibaculum sediminis TaxID=3231907 RepID=UPI0034563324
MSQDISRDRRNFITAGGGAIVGAAAVASTGLSAPAIAQDVRELNMVTSWPKGAPGVGVNAERFARRLERLSGGRLAVRFFGAGELVPPFEVLDAVSGGTADLAHSSPYYWAGSSQALHFFTGIPFGLTATECAAWLEFGGGQALWDEVYAPFGVKAFYAGSSGTQFGGWFNKEINSLDDLHGLRFRIAGLGGEVMRRLGVSPVMTPPGEIPVALASGAVDAVEWIGPWNDMAFGLERMARYYYAPGVMEPGPGLEIMINQGVWESLPEDLQEAVKTAAHATAYETYADFIYHNTESFADMLAETDVEMRSFPDDVNEAIARELENVLDEFSAEDEVFARVRESHDAFLRKSLAYSPQAEGGVLQARAKTLGRG